MGSPRSICSWFRRSHFRLLYGLLVLRHDRRRILWLAVTAHPTAEWIAQQVTEACGWQSAPHYLIRDRDRVYGEAFTRRIRAKGIREVPEVDALRAQQNAGAAVAYGGSDGIDRGRFEHQRQLPGSSS